MDSSVTTMMHGVRGFFQVAHIDWLNRPQRLLSAIQRVRTEDHELLDRLSK